MIHEKFPDYEERIAVGVCGEGSDCLGYDDAVSQDHDYGIGFCMWLTAEDHDAIGGPLQEAYRALIGPSEASRLDFRRGVCTIAGFYQRTLGIPVEEGFRGLTAGQWFHTEEYQLNTAVSGRVFRDDLGIFSGIRRELSAYYPNPIWKMRLANAAHDFAQYAQANYGRSMGRGDLVAAELCKAKGIEAAMNMAFLMERIYGPYYKWKYRALQDLAGYGELAEILCQISVTGSQVSAWEGYTYDPRRINLSDQVEMLFEKAAVFLVGKLREKGLSQGNETFMDYHGAIIAEQVD